MTSSVRSIRVGSLYASVLVGLAAMTGGCASSDVGRERSEKAVDSLRDTRTGLVDGMADIDRTQVALMSLQAGGDLNSKFEKYKDVVEKLDDRAGDTRKQAADMRTRADEYQSQWQQEVVQMSDPTLRTSASQRVEQLRQRYGGIEAKSNSAADAYETYMEQLHEIQLYLSNDLTPAGVAAARPTFDRALSQGLVVKQQISEVVGELDSVSASLTSTGRPRIR